jgi:hypothetical protein
MRKQLLEARMAQIEAIARQGIKDGWATDALLAIIAVASK